LNAGWVFSSTTATAAAPSGWGYDLVNPNVMGDALTPTGSQWGFTKYNAGTDDRTYKTFNLAGTNTNVALLSVSAAANLINGDFLNANFKAIGGDPFTAGTNVFSGTNAKDGFILTPSPKFDISACISTTCSIGFQLTSTPTSLRDTGVAIANFRIDTVTLNSTAQNTINGTSMATPQVAGVAALVWSHNPMFTYADVANAIKDSGRPTPSLAGKTTTGKAVDAMRALSYINQPSGLSVVVH